MGLGLGCGGSAKEGPEWDNENGQACAAGSEGSSAGPSNGAGPGLPWDGQGELGKCAEMELPSPSPQRSRRSRSQWGLSGPWG